jgi:hypothetical protein
VQSLLAGTVEGFFGIRALEVEEAPEGPHSPAVGSFLDLSHIEMQSLRVSAKLFFFKTRAVSYLLTSPGLQICLDSLCFR